MKKFLRITALMLCLITLATSFIIAPPTAAHAAASKFCNLSFINNKEKREYVDWAIYNYLYSYKESTELLSTLKSGFPVIFFFEGASDNLSTNPKVRTGAVCIVLRWDSSKNRPTLVYYSENCSTLPDSPLDYGCYSKTLGPATILDGVYRIQTVNHPKKENGVRSGEYAAFSIRNLSYQNKIDSVYMKDDSSFVEQTATAINIHTRRGSKVSNSGAWSEGCLLVGGSSNFKEYTSFINNTYPKDLSKIKTTTWYGTKIPRYSSGTGKKCGMVVVDRLLYRDGMIDLYRNKDAVEMITSFSANAYKERPTYINIDLNELTSVKRGNSFTLKGAIEYSSTFDFYDDGRRITEVTAYVTNWIGRKVQTVTIKPNTRGLDIRSSKINSNIKFGTLWRGKYTLTVIAKGSDGLYSTLECEFKVK